MTFLPLLLISLASAHYPHDIADYIAISPGPDPTWLVTTLWRTEAWMSVRSPYAATAALNAGDMEVSYIMNGNLVIADPKWPLEIRGGELLDEARVVVATEGLGLWASDDAGLTWAQLSTAPTSGVFVDLQSSPDVYTDGTAMAVGNGVAWFTTDRGFNWTSATGLDGVNLVSVSYSPSFSTDRRVCVLAADSAAYCSTDGGLSFTRMNDTRSSGWQIAVGEGHDVWMASSKGLWYSDDDGVTWAVAGKDAFGSTDVTTIGWFGDGLLLATTKTEGVWRSADSGLTWTLQGDYLEQIYSGSIGPQRDGNTYYEFQKAGDGSIWLSEFDGIAHSTDGGLTWYPVETELQDTVRGLAFSNGPRPDDPLALLGLYGSGVTFTNARTTQASSISATLEWRYLRSLNTTPDFLTDQSIQVTGSGHLYGTLDGGDTWTYEVDPDAPDGQLNYPNLTWPVPGYTENPLWFVASGTGKVGEFATSTDGGLNWSVGATDVECTGGATAVMVSWDYASDGLAWGACDGLLFRSSDAGKTWTNLGDAGSHVYAVAGTPEGAKVFLATDEGLFLSTDGGAPVVTAFSGEATWGVAIAPQWDTRPFVYVITAKSGWYRSIDGGETWEKLAAPTSTVPVTVALSPNFDVDGVVGVGGFGGAWVSLDRGDTWANLSDLELVQESQPGFMAFDGWDSVTDVAASGGSYLRSITPGSKLIYRFRGIAIDLLCPTGAAFGSFTVALDDGTPQTVSLDGERMDHAIAWTAEDLEDTWHLLTITAADGVAAIDAAQIWHVAGIVHTPTGSPGLPVDTAGETGKDTAETAETADTTVDTAETAETAETADSVVDTAGPDDTGAEPRARCLGCGGKMAWTLFFPLPLVWLRRRSRRSSTSLA